MYWNMESKLTGREVNADGTMDTKKVAGEAMAWRAGRGRDWGFKMLNFLGKKYQSGNREIPDFFETLQF